VCASVCLGLYRGRMGVPNNAEEIFGFSEYIIGKNTQKKDKTSFFNFIQKIMLKQNACMHVTVVLKWIVCGC